MLRHCQSFYILSGAAALLCCSLLYFVKGFEDKAEYAVGVNTAMSIYGVGVLAIFVFMVITLYRSILRYYAAFFTDEGYLTMVIPAETKTVLFARLISTYIWILVSIFVAAVSVFLAVIVPNLLYDPRGFVGFINMFFTPDVEYEIGYTVAFIIIGIIQGFAGIFESLSIILLSVTLGTIIFKRRRFLGIVGFYMVISTLQSAIFAVTEYIMLYGTGGNAILVILTMLLSLAVTIGFAVGSYFINLYLFKNKFNIE